jgi:hypothetical protein
LVDQRGVGTAYPNWSVARSTDDMLQAILLTTSLLIVLGMVASLMWLAAWRMQGEREAAPVQAPEHDA